MSIQWYPGHMTKTRRMIEADLRLVDAVCEVIDARIPVSSRNPIIDVILKGKPRLIVLNRSDQADMQLTKKWKETFIKQGFIIIETDCKSGKGIKEFSPAVKSLLKEKIERREASGQSGRTIKVMVVGIPNVGKSSLINKLAGRKTAKAEDRPGVTRGKQWIAVDNCLDLLDTPGILWPKFEDPLVGRNLALTGAINDEILDIEDLAAGLMVYMADNYPDILAERYNIELSSDDKGYELLSKAAAKRGFLIKGGEVDLDRMSRIFLDEFRSGKLGRITLEKP